MNKTEMHNLYIRRSVYIQKIAVQYGNEIAELLQSSQVGMKSALVREITLLNEGRSSLKRVNDILVKFRLPGVREAEKRFNAEMGKLAAQEGRYSQQMLLAVSNEQIVNTVVGVPAFSAYSKKGLSQWFNDMGTGTNAMIMQQVRKGLSQGLSTNKINQMIRPLVDGNKIAAQRLARTAVNGVANDARFVLYQDNADVIKFVQYSATLDASTSAICSVLDGTKWKSPQELDEVRKPPLHPNCRSTLIPLVDDEPSGTRPSANADFNKKGQELHAQSQSGKSWDELTPASREKWYYKAIKEHEAQGKQAFTTVRAKTDFATFLKNSPAEFQKDYLGEARYRLYKSGKFPINKFVDINTGKKLTLADLERKYKRDFAAAMKKD